MALVLADRVQETATANTTVSFTLLGAVTGYQSFAVVGNTNTTYYGASDGTNWEVGIGTYSTTGPTLTRTTILTSSNANAAVTFSGTVTVFVDYPSSKSVYEDASGNVSALGTISSGTWQGTAIALTYGGTGQTTAPAAAAALMGFTTTATAGGTTTLTNTSSQYQVFTGTSAQTIQLPATSTLAQGWSFHLVNNSTKILTVNTSTSVTLGTISPGATMMPTALTTTGNTAADWEVGITDTSVDARMVPQNAQTGNYTLDTTDIGKHIYHASGAGAAVYTIPANSAVPFEIGTTFTFINLSATAPTIAITTDTMYLAGTGTTGTRTLAQYGVATAIKITATNWIISGSGLT